MRNAPATRRRQGYADHSRPGGVVVACSVAALLAFAPAGCVRFVDPRAFGQPLPELGQGDEMRTLQVRFLGVGGFRIRLGDDVVLTAPLTTNPSLPRVLAGRLRTDVLLAHEFLPEEWLAGTDVILVGHGHYDHLMDVAYSWLRTGDDDDSRALVLGSNTVRNVLAGFDRPAAARRADAEPHVYLPGGRVRAVDRYAVSQEPPRDLSERRPCVCRDPALDCTTAPGAWIPIERSHVRILAVCSEHPPQFLFFHLWKGDVERPRQSPPTRAAHMREGRVYAYLIDFLDDDRVLFRVYYQDAPSRAPFGFVPRDVLGDGKRIDLAILNGSLFAKVPGFPGDFLRHHRPRYVMFGHWEDFFRSQSEPLRPVPFQDMKTLLERTERDLAEDSAIPAGSRKTRVGVRYWLPSVGMLFHIPPEGPSQAPTAVTP